MGWRSRQSGSSPYGPLIDTPNLYTIGQYGLEDIYAHYLKGTGFDQAFYQPDSINMASIQAGAMPWSSISEGMGDEISNWVSYPQYPHWEMPYGGNYSGMWQGLSAPSELADEGNWNLWGEEQLCFNHAGNEVPCGNVGDQYTTTGDNASHCLFGPCGNASSRYNFGDYEDLGLTGLAHGDMRSRILSGAMDEYSSSSDLWNQMSGEMFNAASDSETFDDFKDSITQGGTIQSMYNDILQQANVSDSEHNELANLAKDWIDNMSFENMKGIGIDPAEYMSLKTSDYFSAYDDTPERDIKAQAYDERGNISREAAMSAPTFKRSRGTKNVLSNVQSDFDRMKEMVQIKEDVNRHNTQQEIKSLRDAWLTQVYSQIGNLAGGSDPESAGAYQQSYFGPNQFDYMDWEARYGSGLWDHGDSNLSDWYDEYL